MKPTRQVVGDTIPPVKELRDFLSNFCSEVQINRGEEAPFIPKDRELWTVCVNDRLLTHAEVTPGSTDAPKVYRACSFSFFLPAFGSAKSWKELIDKVQDVPGEPFSWIISGKTIPAYKISFKKVKEAEPENNDRHKGIAVSLYWGMCINGLPIRDHVYKTDAYGDCLVRFFAIGHNGDHNVRDYSVLIPLEADCDPWMEKAMAGDVEHIMDEEGGMYILRFKEIGVQLSIRKPSDDDLFEGTFAKKLWDNCIPHWHSEISKWSTTSSAMNLLGKLLVSDAYSLTVSGAPAVHGYLNAIDDSFHIFVQEKDGELTEYDIAQDASCHECDEDGEFKYVPSTEDQSQFIFKVGLVNKKTKECSPVLCVFNKL